MAKSLMDFQGVDTTTPGYWLNWRAFLCFVWIITSISLALYFIKKYEGPNNQRSRNAEGEGEGEGDEGDHGVVLYRDDVWKPCLKGIHPFWLLAFRVFAFSVLFSIIMANAIKRGRNTFKFYTEWTFSLVTTYFLFGSLLSMHGCYHHRHIGLQDQRHLQQAGFWGYMFQIIFQMVGGAVVLTDCVFWCIIVPYLTTQNSSDFSFLTVALHSINAVFLLGDAALNSLRFPWFRIAYFVLWTCFYVIFQWILHACIALGWPYPFLDLAHLLSPLWYLLVALLHFPCYGIFFLLVKLKHFLLKKWFPNSS